MRLSLLGALLAALALGACQKAEEAPAGWPFGGEGHGAPRYAGLGHYTPGRLWAQLKRKAEPADPTAAVLKDDDEILVVVDTRTGEVRQCGNLSGYCLATNPWANSPETTQASPAALVKHLADLEREDAEAAAAHVPGH